MDKKLKVLLLVAEPWRGDDAGGNTINNFFSGMDCEFAQVYCSSILPDNKTCNKYFQITDEEVIKGFFLHKAVGRELVVSENVIFNNTEEDNKKGNKWFSRIKTLRLNAFLTIKRFIWRYSNWKTSELKRFVSEFNPDVIFAPCYGFPFQLALTRFIKDYTVKKVISWSADDNYSLRQFSISPFFWINRFWDRKCLRKTYPYYDEMFSISEDEIEELSPVVGKQMKILRKGIVLPESYTCRDIHNPIRMIYAGGLYLNRYKILMKIVESLKEINKDEIKIILNIYSGSVIPKSALKVLDDKKNSYMRGLISSEELKQKYQDSDVAIHCESFERKYRLATRLSFSTKIIDCVQSGCAILAIAWEEHTGLKYLRNEDAAICVSDISLLNETLQKIVQKPELIKEYAQKAYLCGKRNHDITVLQETLYDSFIRNSSVAKE